MQFSTWIVTSSVSENLNEFAKDQTEANVKCTNTGSLTFWICDNDQMDMIEIHSDGVH